jgi:hypothetical protein
MKTFWKFNQMSQAQREQCESVRKKFAQLEECLKGLPECRNRSLALTHLEDCFLRVECCFLLDEPDAG